MRKLIILCTLTVLALAALTTFELAAAMPAVPEFTEPSKLLL